MVTRYVYTQGTADEADTLFAAGVAPMPGLLTQVIQDAGGLNQTTTYSQFDAAGNLAAKVDANGQRTEYDYNPATNHLIEIRAYDSTGVQTSVCHFSYDTSGRLSGYDDGDTSAAYTYDALGRKLSDTVNYGVFSKTLRSTYYANGQKQSAMMPDGVTYSYTYHDNNGLQEILIPGLGTIDYPSYTLNRPDRVATPGSSQHYQYDALLRLKQISAPEADVNDAYTYDDVSNLLTKSTEHGQYDYGYDAVACLTRAENPTLPAETYAYDGVGNRRTASNAGGSLSHNANNELTLYGNIAYEYDANGNLIRKRLGTVAVNYRYNAQNRLVRVHDELSGLVRI
ncbi:MAG: hypothetical protein RBT80_14700 [Candidatus Vecturithrix sp.]|nr:hypothetical protein [Candidatus Vecturithrix sp.]